MGGKQRDGEGKERLNEKVVQFQEWGERVSSRTEKQGGTEREWKGKIESEVKSKNPFSLPE